MSTPVDIPHRKGLLRLFLIMTIAVSLTDGIANLDTTISTHQ